MSKTKFTPGPWQIGEEDIVAPGMECIDIHSGDIGPNYVRVGCVIGQMNPDHDDNFEITEMDRANAALISAAPKMFEALETIERLTTDLMILEGVRAVLKKARGE